MTVSDHVTVLDYGEVIASGRAAEVQDDPRVVEAYFGTGGASLGTAPGGAGGRGEPIVTTPLLAIDDLKVAYGRIEAVRGVALMVGAGEFVGIIGANGAGKTSTLRAIAGVVAPAERRDQLRWARDRRPAEPRDGRPRHRHGARRAAGLRRPDRARQSPPRRLRAHRPRRRRRHAGHGPRPHARSRASSERLTQQAGSLSGGEQQMLAIARGLLSRPRLLVVDELSLGLAPKMLDVLFPVLVDLNRQGLSILLVEQMTSYALQVTHRTYVMEHGQILMHGPSATLAHDARVVDAYLGRRAATNGGRA